MKKILYTTSAVLILLTGCSDEFLNNTPIIGTAQDDFYQTDEQAFNALTGVYNTFNFDPDLDVTAHFILLGEIRSDNAKTGIGTDTEKLHMQQMEDFTNISVSVVSEGIWKINYRGIYRANLLINSEYDSELAKVYKAESKFLRAWFYFDLLRTYGPCVLSLETVYPADYVFTRASRLAINEQIEKDLLEAIPILEEKHSDDMTGRVTKAAAQALLAKAYIYWADWDNDNKAIFDKAIPLLNKVKENTNYSLSNDFKGLFIAHQENNKESIFEIQRTTTGGQENLGNLMVQWSQPRGLRNHPAISSSWGGLWVPQRNLYRYFLEEDSIRRSTALLTYDDLVTIPNSQGHNVIWDTLIYNQADFDGLEQGKYLPWKGYEVSNPMWRNQPGNERIIRLGEIYLLLAECYLRGTARNEAEAKKLINKLRVAHVGAGDAAKCMTVDEMIAAYPERFPNLLEVLWYERRCELAGEGDRWFDLVRTGRAKEVMGSLYPDAWNDKHYYIPIGAQETGASGGTLTTYPEEPIATPVSY